MEERHALFPDTPPAHLQLHDLQLLRQVVESSAIGTVITDALQTDQPIVYVNRAFEHLTGYAATEILGLNCRFLQGHDQNQPAICTLRNAVSQGQTTTVSLRNYRKGGTLFHNEVTLSPIFGADGTVTHHVGFQNDVTAREEASLQGGRRHEQLTSILERVTDGFASFDHGLNFTCLNAAGISGRCPEELAGQHLITTFPDLADSAIVQAIVRARETGVPQHAISHLIEFGKWIDATVYPAEDRLSVFTRDITDQYAVQEALRVSNERFSKVFQASPMPMVITRLNDQRYMDVNDAFVQATGHRQGEAIGRTSKELGLWADTEVRDQTIGVLAEGERVHDREVRFQTRAGKELDMVVSLVPVELEGEPCIVTIARDVSSEKQARRVLEESEG